ncbi:dTDP-4-dehydrorhamnose 3,5-epimerase [Rhizobium sp. AG855]|uniref:dTDP-4-dehydrorhamnose 3,5-epimerase n=1 Tax=Rhizobium sp. AG855 TaxID=2183898 RepID=UPI000E7144E6|nr:dTDP-4-dehydrorhamnose 3,5-epimerase [Rhizobium sp. AG855]RKE79238.1 dTDP-4-dehydrorhamnose 3,5-epimerase [Rhizobium sp. AG855]
MHVKRLELDGVFTMSPRRFGDDRGYFSETFRQDIFSQNVGDFHFVQDNQSLSAERGTVRGLHFQLAPRAQGKLVRCLTGAIFDVAVDLRSGSPTFGQHVSVELSADNGQQLWIPPGFAHGFCTLTENTIVAYKVTDYYSPEHDRGLLWSDPQIGIGWPLEGVSARLSEKDARQPLLAELGEVFRHEGPTT